MVGFFKIYLFIFKDLSDHGRINQNLQCSFPVESVKCSVSW